MRIGLKLWSINETYGSEIINVIRDGYCQYIELFSFPDSLKGTIAYWKNLHEITGITFVIHAAHFMTGMNLARIQDYTRNGALAEEALEFATELDSETVIFHPGVEGTVSETVRQAKEFADNRFVIENKPFWGLNGEKCVGYSPDEIAFVQDALQCRFCLDFGHAIYAANAIGILPLVYIDNFMKLSPCIFHLTDGSIDGLKDEHRRFGAGSFPIGEIVRLLPQNAMVTNEARKESETNLDDFVNDTKLLNKLSMNHDEL